MKRIALIALLMVGCSAPPATVQKLPEVEGTTTGVGVEVRQVTGFIPLDGSVYTFESNGARCFVLKPTSSGNVAISCVR